MSSNWLALHAQLVRSVNRHSNIALFPKLLPKDVAGGSFRNSGHLLEWLHDQRGDPDLRNTVLRHMLASAVAGGGCSELASELMILALWPGLCLIRGRLRSFRAISQLDADLISGLSIGILRSDPGKVSRVAATLLRNLERDLRRTCMRNAQLVLTAEIDEKIKQFTSDRSDDRPEDIMQAARQQLGEDGLMLVLVHIAGFSQKDVAQFLGITHEAVRKRCQRALERLKKNFDA